MAINGIGGPAFNPYAPGVSRTNPNSGTGTTPPSTTSTTSGSATPQSIAEAIKSDASARATLVNSPNAPDGVDQTLWSVLTKEERSYFVKAGAMGPLTYGRSSQPQTATTAPIMRGGRLDIKA